MSIPTVLGSYEATPDGFVVRNVNECSFCGGPVDRFCSKYPDKLLHYSTLYFKCSSCGAMGDPVTGIMIPPLGIKVSEVEEQKVKKDLALKEMFLRGYIAGMEEYAWWKDGVQYVGSCGMTLKKAKEMVMHEHAIDEDATT